METDAAREARLSRTVNRPKWDRSIEFLMSCIATSVGLGNVWRFPFVAYQNGGGAFLIPYIIVLLVIGKPMYYLETVLGQFSSSNNVKIWNCCPAMKGTGYAQTLGATYVLTYYVSIIALCLYYLIVSFQSPLPWSVCRPEWGHCVSAAGTAAVVDSNTTTQGMAKSSAELYFTNVVLRRLDGIDNGIGWPLLDLSGYLLLSWVIIFLIVAGGVKSSGKASYFLALFPYVVLIILLLRAVTLPGSGKGIKFFFQPEWSKVLQLKMRGSLDHFQRGFIFELWISVWYAAVTQVFFSLSVCSGALIMFASYNGFRQNVFRDSMIVTTLDTLTSLLSGSTIFGILGNLAYELQQDSIEKVIGAGGTGLAFISYPDAIAKSPFAPQLFSVLFFLMMAVLGVGSGVALLSTISTVMMDAFPEVKTIYISAIACFGGFLVGLFYVTPGGQYVLELVDYYGGTFLRLFAAICEALGIFWLYGLENMCLDIQFMLGIKPIFYWRICWAIVTPFIMISVFIYGLVATNALMFGGVYRYPKIAYLMGNMLQYTGMALVPFFIIKTMLKYKSDTCKKTVQASFTPNETYGPTDEYLHLQWKRFHAKAKESHEQQTKNHFAHVLFSLISGYKRVETTS